MGFLQGANIKQELNIVVDSLFIPPKLTKSFLMGLIDILTSTHGMFEVQIVY